MRILLGLFWLFATEVNTAHFRPAIRAQIERAATEAKARPHDIRAAALLAMTLHAYQQYDAAARAYSRLKELDPRTFDWPYLLGAAQMELGNFDAAAKSFQLALQIHPDDLAAQLRLAQSLTVLPKWDDAGAVYRHILDGHRDCAQAWYGLGRVQAAKGDHAGAAQSYEKACDLFPLYGAAHFALAAELRKAGKTAEAGQQIAAYADHVTDEPPLDDPLFERIHELNQGVTAHIQRGAALERAGRLEDAIREHEAALMIDPSEVQVHINLGSLYGRIGDGAKAKQHLENAIKMSPGRSDAWYNYGVLLSREQTTAEAEKAFLRAIEINPHYAEAHNNLGAIYQQKGRLDAAENEFRDAVADQPDYPLAHFQLGRLLVNQNKYDEAIQQFLKSLQPDDEKTPAYLYALGATYARAGDREHALQYLQKARDGAVAYKQIRLLTSIERDLHTLQQ